MSLPPLKEESLLWAAMIHKVVTTRLVSGLGVSAEKLPDLLAKIPLSTRKDLTYALAKDIRRTLDQLLYEDSTCESALMLYAGFPGVIEGFLDPTAIQVPFDDATTDALCDLDTVDSIALGSVVAIYANLPHC